MKKAILIAPANDFAGNVNVAQLTTLLAPPLGILSIGSYLVQHNIPVELIDVQIDFGFGLTRAADQTVSRRVAEHLRDQASNIAWVGISQLSNSGSGMELAKEIHTALPDTPLVLGGYFPTSVYQLLLQEYPFITAIVRGDGEEVALHISRSLAQGHSFLSEETPNLAWMDRGEIRTSPVQPVALDDMPIFDFRLLRNPSSYQIIDLITSRGCPFECNYCLEGSMRPYATYSPEWVDQQLTHLESALPNDRIFIYDPVFGLGKKRTQHMCRVLGKHRFTYGVESRVDILPPDLIPDLRDAGVETIFWGIESASTSTLLRMDKVRSEAKAKDYPQNALEVLRACFENNITPVMPFMLSFPGDTEADYQTSLEFVRQIGRLHNQVAAQTGQETGFAIYSFYTKIYDGSSLAERMAHNSHNIILRDEPFIGERTVLSPSPGVTLDVTKRYQGEIARQAAYTPLALERMQKYFAFSLADFLESHPELTDDEGVILVGDSLQRSSQAFKPASMLVRYDKSKN